MHVQIYVQVKMAELVPNSSLLNPGFNGYKLSAERLNFVSLPLSNPYKILESKNDSFSYIYVKSRDMYNNLFTDTWNNLVYFVDSNHDLYCCMNSSTEDSTSHLTKILSVPSREEKTRKLKPSLSFPTGNVLVTNDGSGFIHLINSDRRSTHWNYNGSVLIYDFHCPSVLLNTYFDADANTFNLLVSTLQEVCREDLKSIYNVIQWVKLKCASDFATFTVVSVKKFIGKTLHNAAWTDSSSAHLLIASDKKFVMVENSTLEPVKEQVGVLGKLYTWHQCREFISITFHGCVCESDVVCNIKEKSISVKLVANGSVLLDGELENEIDINNSKWFVIDQRLKIILWKQHADDFWRSPVPSDDCGVHEISGEEEERVQEIHHRLQHLTSECEQIDDGETSTFNMQQLEECDSTVEDDIMVYVINCMNGAVNVQRNLIGHQWQFHVQMSPNELPLVCLRHDVDGIVWQVDACASGESAWEHVKTLDAIGYVQASKQDHKFTTCSPSFNHVIITDCSSNVFIYDADPTKKTCRRQYVVSLKGCSRILGCQATNTHVLVLCDTQLCVITLPLLSDMDALR